MITFLINSKEIAQAIAISFEENLKIIYDGFNCIKFVQDDGIYRDRNTIIITPGDPATEINEQNTLATVKSTVALLKGEFCHEWDFCPLKNPSLISYSVGAIIKTTRLIEVGQFPQGTLGIITKQYTQADFDSFESLAKANFCTYTKPLDLYEVTLIKNEETLFAPDPYCQNYILTTQSLESTNFFLLFGDAKIEQEYDFESSLIEILKDKSTSCTRSLLVSRYVRLFSSA